MKKRVLIALLTLVLTVCAVWVLSPDARAAGKSAGFDTVYVAKNEAAGLYGDVALIADGGSSYTLYLPGSADVSRLCFSWDNSVTVTNEYGVKMVSGKLSVPAVGTTCTYAVNGTDFRISTVQGSADVQAMFIEIDESIDGFSSFNAMDSDKNKETEAAGTMAFAGTDSYYFSIKGRGNATWGREKNPYNITIYKDATYDKKLSAELIDGVKAKKWSLLANYYDSSLMRNKLAYDMAVELGIGLESVFVDLWVDGKYHGSYLMTPKSDYDAPENGYLLEIDNYTDKEDPNFAISGMTGRITVKDNEAGAATADIQSYMKKAWNAVKDESSEEYLNYIDLDSWARFFLLHEFYKSFDVMSGSIFMHRDGTGADDKLIAGPVWDLDNSMGKVQTWDGFGLTYEQQHSPDGWYIESINSSDFWLQELGQHGSFMERVYALYQENKHVFDGAANAVGGYMTQLEDSALMNFDYWGYTSGRPKITAADDCGCVKTAVWKDFGANLRNYAAKRAEFLDANILIGELRISGQVAVGKTLAASMSGGSGKLTYTWTCGSRTATGQNFTVRSADIGKDITVTVTDGTRRGNVSVTLEAVRVTFDNGGGTGGTVSACYVYTGSAYGSLPSPTRTGYTFAGWFTGADGSGKQITAATTVANAADHTLYAFWKQNAAAPEPTPEPSAEATEPSAEAAEPTTVETEPSVETTAPTTAVTEPSVETTAPRTDVTEPSAEATEPSTDVTQPTGDGMAPSTGAAGDPTEATETAGKDPGKGLHPLAIILPAVLLAALAMLVLLLKRRKKAAE